MKSPFLRFKMEMQDRNPSTVPN